MKSFNRHFGVYGITIHNDKVLVVKKQAVLI